MQPYSNGIIVEFGAGESTNYFVSNCERLFTFETSKTYLRKFDSLVKANPGKFDTFHFNIGPTNSWGRPILPESFIRRKVIQSIQTIQAYLKNVEFTTLFIDGRYRVASTLALVVSSQHNFSIVIDDYYDRHDYKILSDYLGPPKPLSSDFAKFDADPSLSSYVNRGYRWEHVSQA